MAFWRPFDASNNETDNIDGQKKKVIVIKSDDFFKISPIKSVIENVENIRRDISFSSDTEIPSTSGVTSPYFSIPGTSENSFQFGFPWNFYAYNSAGNFDKHCDSHRYTKEKVTIKKRDKKCVASRTLPFRGRNIDGKTTFLVEHTMDIKNNKNEEIKVKRKYTKRTNGFHLGGKNILVNKKSLKPFNGKPPLNQEKGRETTPQTKVSSVKNKTSPSMPNLIAEYEIKTETDILPFPPILKPRYSEDKERIVETIEIFDDSTPHYEPHITEKTSVATCNIVDTIVILDSPEKTQKKDYSLFSPTELKKVPEKIFQSPDETIIKVEHKTEPENETENKCDQLPQTSIPDNDPVIDFPLNIGKSYISTSEFEKILQELESMLNIPPPTNTQTEPVRHEVNTENKINLETKPNGNHITIIQNKNADSTSSKEEVTSKRSEELSSDSSDDLTASINTKDIFQVVEIESTDKFIAEVARETPSDSENTCEYVNIFDDVPTDQYSEDKDSKDINISNEENSDIRENNCLYDTEDEEVSCIVETGKLCSNSQETVDSVSVEKTKEFLISDNISLNTDINNEILQKAQAELKKPDNAPAESNEIFVEPAMNDEEIMLLKTKIMNGTINKEEVLQIIENKDINKDDVTIKKVKEEDRKSELLKLGKALKEEIKVGTESFNYINNIIDLTVQDENSEDSNEDIQTKMENLQFIKRIIPEMFPDSKKIMCSRVRKIKRIKKPIRKLIFKTIYRMNLLLDMSMKDVQIPKRSDAFVVKLKELAKNDLKNQAEVNENDMRQKKETRDVQVQTTEPYKDICTHQTKEKGLSIILKSVEKPHIIKRRKILQSIENVDTVNFEDDYMEERSPEYGRNPEECLSWDYSDEKSTQEEINVRILERKSRRTSRYNLRHIVREDKGLHCEEGSTIGKTVYEGTPKKSRLCTFSETEDEDNSPKQSLRRSTRKKKRPEFYTDYLEKEALKKQEVLGTKTDAGRKY